ncbi:MAG: ATP-dependent sacrificial sulfur transferase LarE [Actinomycetota bacterium]|nr:ATP-dependent sacrificial sulfur transferase LarE [Actinomycetota bacterium]
MTLTPDLQEKYEKLKGILRDMQSVLVGFSGGVDSTFLLKVAHDELADNVLAVTASSATLSWDELEESKQLAQIIGAPHLVIEADELKCAEFVKNPPDRCYHCKKLRFSILRNLQLEHNLKWLADGTNADDEDDWRPGIKAAAELGVRSPLKEAGLTKLDIRELAAAVSLPNWDKPSMACLASRIPYGEEITEIKLQQIAEAEKFLRGLGLRQLRVRHHGNTARIEVPKDDWPRVIEQSEMVVEKLKEVGFHFVSLDLSGFRSGSLNCVLAKKSFAS